MVRKLSSHTYKIQSTVTFLFNNYINIKTLRYIKSRIQISFNLSRGGYRAHDLGSQASRAKRRTQKNHVRFRASYQRKGKYFICNW